MNIIWRVAGLVLAVGLALFLLTLILKVLLVGLGAFLLVRVVGARLAGRTFGRFDRGGWQSSDIISIDNPGYRLPVSSRSYDRIIPIN
ncbi:hypothetical protein GCM10028808_51000 [Spirosoma migulaei]